MTRMATAAPAPKVLAQAIASIVVYVLARFGVDLDSETSAAIAVVIGFALGYIVRPGQVVTEPAPGPGDSGQAFVSVIGWALAALIVVVLLIVALRIA